MLICVIRGKNNRLKKLKMSKKNIIMAIIAFIVGFSITFYAVKTYFPKHKTEETTNLK